MSDLREGAQRALELLARIVDGHSQQALELLYGKVWAEQAMVAVPALRAALAEDALKYAAANDQDPWQNWTKKSWDESVKVGAAIRSRNDNP